MKEHLGAHHQHSAFMPAGGRHSAQHQHQHQHTTTAGLFHSPSGSRSSTHKITGGDLQKSNIKFMGSSPVVVALAAFLASLGGGGGGSGGGGDNHGNWGGGNDGDITEKIIDYLFGKACVPCQQICKHKMTIPVDIPKVMHATVGLVHAMDGALRKYKKTTLSKYLYTYLTNLINAKLVRKGIPLRIKPVFAMAPLLQYDITKGARIKVLEYVFEEYVHYYLPSVKYNVKTINSEIFKPFKSEIMTFLRGGDGDLGPLSAAMVKHVLEKNHMTSIHANNPACMLCKKLPLSCASKKKRVKKEIFKRVKQAAFG